MFCICKIYTNSFIIYPSFLNNFSMTSKFPQSFSKYSSDFFFFNFNEFYSLILFSNFQCIFSTVPQSFIDIFSSFFQIPQVSIRLQLKFAQIFILVYLKIFLQDSKFQAVFKFFLDYQIIFLK